MTEKNFCFVGGKTLNAFRPQVHAGITHSCPGAFSTLGNFTPRLLPQTHAHTCYKTSWNILLSYFLTDKMSRPCFYMKNKKGRQKSAELAPISRKIKHILFWGNAPRLHRSSFSGACFLGPAIEFSFHRPPHCRDAMCILILLILSDEAKFYRSELQFELVWKFYYKTINTFFTYHLLKGLWSGLKSSLPVDNIGKQQNYPSLLIVKEKKRKGKERKNAFETRPLPWC